MHRFIIAAVAMLATSIPTAAQAGDRLGSDGYYWYKAEFEKPTVEVRLFLFKSRKALTERYNAMGGSLEQKSGIDKTPRLNAFSGFNRTTQTCDIFAIDPAVEYRPEDFGHELMHCFYGQWHAYTDQ